MSRGRVGVPPAVLRVSRGTRRTSTGNLRPLQKAGSPGSGKHSPRMARMARMVFRGEFFHPCPSVPSVVHSPRHPWNFAEVSICPLWIVRVYSAGREIRQAGRPPYPPHVPTSPSPLLLLSRPVSRPVLQMVQAFLCPLRPVPSARARRIQSRPCRPLSARGTP